MEAVDAALHHLRGCFMQRIVMSAAIPMGDLDQLIFRYEFFLGGGA